MIQKNEKRVFFGSENENIVWPVLIVGQALLHFVDGLCGPETESFLKYISTLFPFFEMGTKLICDYWMHPCSISFCHITCYWNVYPWITYHPLDSMMVVQ